MSVCIVHYESGHVDVGTQARRALLIFHFSSFVVLTCCFGTADAVAPADTSAAALDPGLLLSRSHCVFVLKL